VGHPRDVEACVGHVNHSDSGQMHRNVNDPANHLVVYVEMLLRSGVVVTDRRCAFAYTNPAITVQVSMPHESGDDTCD